MIYHDSDLFYDIYNIISKYNQRQTQCVSLILNYFGMAYTKMSDHTYLTIPTATHLHSSPPSPTHPKYTSTQPHLPPPTHKKCLPSSTYSKCTIIHLQPPKICLHPPIEYVHPPLSTQNIPPSTHKKWPLTPTHPKHTSMQPHPYKICLHSPPPTPTHP